MEPIDPAYGTTTLLLIAGGAVALLLFLIMGLKLHAFLALVLVSVLTAVAPGSDFADVPFVPRTSSATRIGTVALLVAFGAMLGRLLEVTGGAQVLADTLINRFGEKRAPFALGVAALLFGFPIFFDAGLVVFLPIIFSVARRFGGSLLSTRCPRRAPSRRCTRSCPRTRARSRRPSSSRRHRPHPADGHPGRGRLLVRRLLPLLPVPRQADLRPRRRHGRSPRVRTGEGGGGRPTRASGRRRFGLVLALLLVPLLLIARRHPVRRCWSPPATLHGGFPVYRRRRPHRADAVALLITLLFAKGVRLGPQGPPVPGRDRKTILNDALAPICAIILITGGRRGRHVRRFGCCATAASWAQALVGLRWLTT